MRDTFSCDLCGKFVRETDLTTSAQPMNLTIRSYLFGSTGQLQGDHLEYKPNETCAGCRRHVLKATRDAINERMALWGT